MYIGGNNMNNYVKENFALDLKEDFEIADFKKRVKSFRTKRSYMNLLSVIICLTQDDFVKELNLMLDNINIYLYYLIGKKPSAAVNKVIDKISDVIDTYSPEQKEELYLKALEKTLKIEDGGKYDAAEIKRLREEFLSRYELTDQTYCKYKFFKGVNRQEKELLINLFKIIVNPSSDSFDIASAIKQMDEDVKESEGKKEEEEKIENEAIKNFHENLDDILNDNLTPEEEAEVNKQLVEYTPTLKEFVSDILKEKK